MNENTNVVRLPLWRSALDELLANGVEYGQVIPAEWFEQRLKAVRKSMQFGLAVSEIRRALETKGFYLCGRGQNGAQFVILPPENNSDVMEHYQRMAKDALVRGVILGTNTRLDLLRDEDRRRHETLLEKMAFKSVLLGRSQAIRKIVKQHAPKLLKTGTEP